MAVLGPIMMLTPPARASSHSPFQMLSAARCTATSELEHAVSTVMLGSAEVEGVRDPVRQHCHHHPGGGMGLEPVAAGAALVLQQLVVEGEAADEHADVGARQPSAGIPPSSKASHVVCSSRRCCGSRRFASRGEIPKNWGSNWSISLRNPPRARHHLADFRRIRIVVFRGVPTCFGDRAGGIGLVAQQAPVALRGIGAARGTGTRFRRSPSASRMPWSAGMFILLAPARVRALGRRRAHRCRRVVRPDRGHAEMSGGSIEFECGYVPRIQSLADRVGGLLVAVDGCAALAGSRRAARPAPAA